MPQLLFIDTVNLSIDVMPRSQFVQQKRYIILRRNDKCKLRLCRASVDEQSGAIFRVCHPIVIRLSIFQCSVDKYFSEVCDDWHYFIWHLHKIYGNSKFVFSKYANGIEPVLLCGWAHELFSSCKSEQEQWHTHANVLKIELRMSKWTRIE